MILSPEILTIFILNIIFFFFGTIAFFLSLKIFFKWNIKSTSQIQYNLEQKSFLSATIIKYILFIKILLFAFFIFTLDKISHVLTGAMCAAGVTDATSFGIYLLLFKLINIYLFGFWLVIHKMDMKTKTLKYTKLKFGFFLFIYILLIIEIILELSMFSLIDVKKLVSCCGTLYSNSSGSYFSFIFSLEPKILLGVFYSIFSFLILFYFLRRSYLYIVFNFFFLLFALVSLITFFGTYIYELPTHHCPFCMLQKEYHFIGYFLYTFLFLGTFYGFNIAIKKAIDIKEDNLDSYYKISIFFIVLYVLLVTYFPVAFYLKNGVLL